MSAGEAPPGLARLVRAALQEDIGPGDVTSAAVIPAGARGRARIVARQEMILSGLEAALIAFKATDPQSRVTPSAAEGDRLAAGGEILAVEGSTAAILAAERTALNFLAWLSGIATLTRRCVETVAGTRAAILDTRKTLPGMRPLVRQAVRSGGGANHRFGLYDACLIKDNHIAQAGGAGVAVAAAVARGVAGPIEVEIDRLDQIDEAIAAGAAILLLDNMSPAAVAEATRRIRAQAPGRVQVEASGGITLETLRAYAEAGVDRISLGFITHSAPAADLSLELEPLAS